MRLLAAGTSLAAAGLCLSVEAKEIAMADGSRGGSNQGLAGRRLVQIAFVTEDLDRARIFYRDILGLPLLFEAGRMLFFDVGGQRLMIGEDGGSGIPPGGGIIYFDASDFDELMSELETRGVVFTSPVEVLQRNANSELRLREFLDPDGNHIALMGEVALGGR